MNHEATFKLDGLLSEQPVKGMQPVQHEHNILAEEQPSATERLTMGVMVESRTPFFQ